VSTGQPRQTYKKTDVRELAVFGGIPLFTAPLHVGRPNIPNRKNLIARFNDMLDRRWLTNNGAYTVDFERQVALIAGTKHCVAVSNATIGLQLLVRALGWKGEVIVPSFTFVASAHALLWEGVTPMFADIGEQGYCIDPESVEALVTPRTTGILPVHLFGELCDFDALDAIARRHNLTVVYDAAHALGCTHRQRPIGGYGSAAVFSFHATKFLNSFEGGAIVTDRDDIAEQLRLMRNFGFSAEDTVESLGINAKMSEVSAAMGLTSIEEMDQFIAINRAHYNQYRSELNALPGLTLAPRPEKDRRNFQYVVLDVDPSVAGISRDDLHLLLNAEGVHVRRYFYPGCHRVEPYRSMFPNAPERLARTETAAARLLCLPTGSGISSPEISRLCELFRFIFANVESIDASLHQAKAGVARR
jgi:dTDP-4-amino-4,6-dideoxygalactose transaminase